MAVRQDRNSMERERPDSQKQHRADTPVAPTMARTQKRPRPTREHRRTRPRKKRMHWRTPMCNADMADVMALYPGRKKKNKRRRLPKSLACFSRPVSMNTCTIWFLLACNLTLGFIALLDMALTWRICSILQRRLLHSRYLARSRILSILPHMTKAWNILSRNCMISNALWWSFSSN